MPLHNSCVKEEIAKEITSKWQWHSKFKKKL